METTINSLVIGFTFLVILIVERFMYRKAISVQKIAEHQKVLDKMDKNAKIKYNLDWKHDAETEILYERKQIKSFTIIFSGIFLVFVLIGLAMFISIPLSSIGIICVSGIILICYGLIKIAESKKLAVIMLIFIFVLGTGMMIIFDHLMTLSPYTFFYLVGLIFVIGFFRHEIFKSPKFVK